MKKAIAAFLLVPLFFLVNTGSASAHSGHFCGPQGARHNTSATTREVAGTLKNGFLWQSRGRVIHKEKLVRDPHYTNVSRWERQPFWTSFIRRPC